MATRKFLLAALLWAASAAYAAPLNWTPVVHPVPVIPYGLDWSILTAPDPQPVIAKLSDEDIKQILPPVLKLGYLNAENDYLHLGSPISSSPVGPITAMLIGSVLLLAAYDLIPRVHSRVSRFRSIDLRTPLT